MTLEDIGLSEDLKSYLRENHQDQPVVARVIREHRELFVLDNGGIIIDTPGMKELGLTDDAGGLSATFSDINDLAAGCRFPDCLHINETGCAVLEAVENGTIDRDSYEN